MQGFLQRKTAEPTAEISQVYNRQSTGMLFRDFVVSIVKKRQARSYLEIGVRDGATISQIDCDTIGVDPQFVFNCNPVGNKKALHLYSMTSDDFFRKIDVKKILGSSVDVVFLDGLHLFEYLLRDFINAEKVCSPRSLIMLDDCIPVNVEMSERYHKPEQRRDTTLAGWWTGDVWKVVKILKEYRPDLRIIPVDTSPTGNICVTNLDPESNLLSEKYFEIVDKYKHEMLDDKKLEGYFRDLNPIPAETILNEFDWSLYLGA